ncbi:MAG: hypothetical protein JO255_00755 [Alphaproteobacteria bacterium]|nr:hypothetical protein [Alphaproteobacteria bacterium]
MRAVLLLSCLVLTLAGFDLAQAQQPIQDEGLGKPGKTDRIEKEDSDTETPAQEDAGRIMERTLPLRDGQTLRYYSGDGVLEGWARRRRLTITFYNADGTPIGRAERVSQAATRYFAADGTYLGRRLNQRLATAPAVTDYYRFLTPPDQGAGGE